MSLASAEEGYSSRRSSGPITRTPDDDEEEEDPDDDDGGCAADVDAGAEEDRGINEVAELEEATAALEDLGVEEDDAGPPVEPLDPAAKDDDAGAPEEPVAFSPVVDGAAQADTNAAVTATRLRRMFPPDGTL